MRYVYAGNARGRIIRADWSKGFPPSGSTCEIYITDIEPLPGLIRVIVQPQWAGIANDFTNAQCCIEGTWEECFPTFQFACGLMGVKV